MSDNLSDFSLERSGAARYYYDHLHLISHCQAIVVRLGAEAGGCRAAAGRLSLLQSGRWGAAGQPRQTDWLS